MSANQNSDLTDEELLAKFRSSGDNIWIGNLLQRYTLLLLGVAMKYLKDRDEAQDAVQQVFLKAITHLPEGEIHNFKGWLYILMRNYCLQLLRDKTYHTDADILVAVPEETTNNGVIYTEEQINDAIEMLNEQQKECIVLFYLKKLSYQQIMEQTGYTFIQVKSYIQNGKRNLKQILLKKFGEANG